MPTSASTVLVAWKDVCLGDPLCCPYAVQPVPVNVLGESTLSVKEN